MNLSKDFKENLLFKNNLLSSKNEVGGKNEKQLIESIESKGSADLYSFSLFNHN